MTANLIQANGRQAEQELVFQTSPDSIVGFNPKLPNSKVLRSNTGELWDSELLTGILDEFSSSESSSEIYVVDGSGYRIIL